MSRAPAPSVHFRYSKKACAICVIVVAHRSDASRIIARSWGLGLTCQQHPEGSWRKCLMLKHMEGSHCSRAPKRSAWRALVAALEPLESRCLLSLAIATAADA